MAKIFNDIDLDERRFQQADVVAITELPPKTLQNWNQRGVIPAQRQSPGKPVHRLYTGFEVFAIDVMGKLTAMTRVPPTDALDIAKAAVSIVLEGLDDPQDSFNDERALYIMWEKGKMQAWSDDPLAERLVSALKRSEPHLVLPVCRMFINTMNRMVTRVYGTNWHRENLLTMLRNKPEKELQWWLDEIDNGILSGKITRADIEDIVTERQRREEKRS